MEASVVSVIGPMPKRAARCMAAAAWAAVERSSMHGSYG